MGQLSITHMLNLLEKSLLLELSSPLFEYQELHLSVTATAHLYKLRSVIRMKLYSMVSFIREKSRQMLNWKTYAM